MSRRIRPLAISSFAWIAVAASGQTLQQLRDAVREVAGNARVSTFVAGMVDLSEISQLSASHLTVSGPPDLVMQTIKLPWRHDYELGERLPELHVEAGLGYFVNRAVFEDIWSGSLPGLETRVQTRWEGFSGYLGAGPRFDLGSGLHLTTLADVSLAYTENHAIYSGPGAAATEALMRGILFDWHATSATFGGALNLEHDLALDEHRQLTSLLRYDLRRFDVIDSTDAAQESADTLQRVIARSELRGPTGIEMLGRQLDWNAHVGYVRFLGPNDHAIGFVDYYEIGAGLAAPAQLAFVTGLTLDGAVMFGEEVRGWTIGFGLAF